MDRILLVTWLFSIDETGHMGIGEVPGVGKITAALEQVKKYVIGA
ncbi:hypothetical protein [Megasphaera sueciensis]|jgi:glucarate dehydratase